MSPVRHFLQDGRRQWNSNTLFGFIHSLQHHCLGILDIRTSPSRHLHVPTLPHRKSPHLPQQPPATAANVQHELDQHSHSSINLSKCIFALVIPSLKNQMATKLPECGACESSLSYEPASIDSYWTPVSQAVEKEKPVKRNLLSHYSKKCVKTIQRIFYCLTHLVIKLQ